MAMNMEMSKFHNKKPLKVYIILLPLRLQSKPLTPKFSIGDKKSWSNGELFSAVFPRFLNFRRSGLLFLSCFGVFHR